MIKRHRKTRQVNFGIRDQKYFLCGFLLLEGTYFKITDIVIKYRGYEILGLFCGCINIRTVRTSLNNISPAFRPKLFSLKRCILEHPFCFEIIPSLIKRHHIDQDDFLQIKAAFLIGDVGKPVGCSKSPGHVMVIFFNVNFNEQRECLQ